MNDEAKARELVRRRSGGRCEAPSCYSPQEAWAHRIARGRVGKWTPPNGLGLCHRHHQASHDRQHASLALGWMLPTLADPSIVGAFIRTEAYGDGWAILHPDGSVGWLDPADWPYPSEALAIIEAFGQRKDRPA